MITSTLLPVPDSITESVEREWRRLAAPGMWMTGEERVAAAEVARAAVAATDRPETVLDASSAEAAEAIAAAPAHIDVEWLNHLESQGLDRLFYGEMIGVVSRLMAVDSFSRAVESPLLELPDPAPGVPSREKIDRAAINDAWVPTVGAARAPTVLSANRPEMLAQKDIHTGFYLAYEDVSDMGYSVDGLDRAQIEVIGARTSYVNHCVY